MSWLSDWREAEDNAERARLWAEKVGCNSKSDCPGTDHLLECKRRRREYREWLASQKK